MTASTPFHGVLNIYKEAGFTSSDVVVKLRGILRMRKIGHTGTLDPAAEGVLPVCLGKATKLVPLLTDHDKVYVATCRLGVRTDTQDMTGAVLEEISDEEVRRRLPGGEADIQKAAAAFVGGYDQLPPMFSAVKVGGKKLYELAREGKTVVRTPRRVEIYDITLLSWDPPRVTLQIHCGKGTYIRTLCEDLGERLGTHGAMETLLRTRVGACRLEEAHRLADLEERMRKGRTAVEEILRPVDSFFPEAPRLELSGTLLSRLQNGNPLPLAELADLPAGERYRLYDTAGDFLALYRRDEKKALLVPEQMFL